MKLCDVHGPEDVRNAKIEDLKELAEDIRQTIVRTVSANGGHLSSNLGAVELTLALYHVFDFSKDKLIFDVGHQCYTHKLITGRKDRFDSIRCDGGISGFPRKSESVYDLFNTGHSSTAISLGLGLCRARDFAHGKERVIAVVGDGALTGGMCYEALNDMSKSVGRMIIILNDNGMSISGNVGALSDYLTYMRVSKGWQTLKHTFSKALLRVPVAGKKLHGIFQRMKDHVKNIFIHDKFFSSLGIRYFGPVDGHNIKYLTGMFRKISDFNEPVLIHVMTKKGKGYPPAETLPDKFHGVGPFDAATGALLEKEDRSLGRIAAGHLADLCAGDGRIAVVTAAMTQGTGMSRFAEAYPDRLFDVGIAEEHAVTMAAGMARGGMRPFAAIYDTFLQRSYDQILEDVCFQKLPVTFLIDRAGLASGDGASHQGIYGLSYLRSIPGMQIFCPRCADELKKIISWSLTQDLPAAIRYPKSEPACGVPYTESSFIPGKWETVSEGDDACIAAVGSMIPAALEAARLLKEAGIRVRVLNASSVWPLDTEALAELSQSGVPLFTAEENEKTGGFGAGVAMYCMDHSLALPKHIFALPDDYLPHGSRAPQLAKYGIGPREISDVIRRVVSDERTR